MSFSKQPVPGFIVKAVLAIFASAGLSGVTSGHQSFSRNWAEFAAGCQRAGGIPRQNPLRCDSASPPPQQQQQLAPLDPRMFWIGAVMTVQGEVVMIYPAGQRLVGAEAARAAIPLGARVITGPGGRVQIGLPDGTSFTMGHSSEMVMDRWVYDPDPSLTKVAINVVKGVFRFVTGSVVRRDPGSMRVSTPVGVIGFRGTDVEVSIDPDGSGQVIMHHGSIEFTDFDGTLPLVVQAGQRLRWVNFRNPTVE